MKRGATLIEILVIIAIFAIVAALGVGALETVKKQRSRQAAASNSIPVLAPSSLRAEELPEPPPVAPDQRIKLMWSSNPWNQPQMWLYHDSASGADILVFSQSGAVVLPGR